MSLVDAIGPFGATLAAQGPFAVGPGAGMTFSSTNPRANSGANNLLVSIGAAAGAFTKQLAADSNKMSMTFAVRPEMTHTTTVALGCMRSRDSAGTKYAEIQLRRIISSTQSEVLLFLTDGTLTDTQTHSITLTDNVWYVIQYVIDMSANPWLGQWRIRPDSGGWTDGPPSSIASAATLMRYYQVGTGSTASGYQYRLQDVGVASAQLDFPTDCYLFEDVPTADGTHSPGTSVFFKSTGTPVAIDGSTTDAYTYVDDTPNYETGTDKVEMHSGGSSSNYVEFKFTSTPWSDEPVIVGARTFWKQASANGTDHPIIRMVEGLDSIDLITATINSTSGVYQSGFSGPASGGPWSKSRLSAMKWRLVYPASIGASSVPSLETFALIVGVPASVPINTAPAGVSSAQAVGSPTVQFKVPMTGASSPQSFGIVSPALVGTGFAYNDRLPNQHTDTADIAYRKLLALGYDEPDSREMANEFPGTDVPLPS